MKKTYLLTAFLLALFSFSAQAKTEEEVNNYLKQMIVPDFTVENMSAEDALALIQTKASLNQNHIFYNIAARDKVKKGVVTLAVQNVSVYDLLTMICTLCKVEMAIKKDQILIFEGGHAAPP